MNPEPSSSLEAICWRATLTIIPAFRTRYDKHRKWAKITAPLWLYVSVTGVLVYLMLYVWFPPR